MANIQVRVDDTLKAQADALFADIGMDLTTAIRVFLKQSVMRRSIPFELRADSHNDYVLRALDEADEEAKNPGSRTEHEDFIREMRAYVEEISDRTDTAV